MSVFVAFLATLSQAQIVCHVLFKLLFNVLKHVDVILLFVETFVRV